MEVPQPREQPPFEEIGEFHEIIPALQRQFEFGLDLADLIPVFGQRLCAHSKIPQPVTPEFLEKTQFKHGRFKIRDQFPPQPLRHWPIVDQHNHVDCLDAAEQITDLFPGYRDNMVAEVLKADGIGLDLLERLPSRF